MMNVADIAERISHPEHIRNSDLQALKELTDKYPYSQIFPILYLKGLSSCADIHFEEELQKLSYRISDRVQLYTIIHNHSAQEEVVVPEEVIIEPEKITVEALESPSEEIITEKEVTEQPEEIIENIPEPEETITEKQEEEPVEQEVVKTTEEAKEDVIEPEPESPVVAEPDSDYQTPQKDKLEETILHHAMAANYQLEELSPEEEAALEAREQATETDEEEEVEIPTKVQDEEPSAAHSFTDWLHADSNYTEQDTTEKEAINAVVEDFAEFDPTDEDLFGEVQKPKAEFFSPTKKARESLDENKLPVSETLAKIYTMQGNYPKAIAAYKELSLAFPEKKIFFANLIEDLEKKLNK